MENDINNEDKPESLSFVNKFKKFEHDIINRDESQRRCSLIIQPNMLLKQNNRHSYDSEPSSRKYSMNDFDNQQHLSLDIESPQLSQENIDTEKDTNDGCNATTLITASSVPLTKCLSTLIQNIDRREFPSRNFSLRQKKTHKTERTNILQYKSLSNISTLEKNTLIKELTMSKKLSNANASSMASLFEDEYSQSTKSEYRIDWKAIYIRISEKTTNEIELSLINYFHNLNNNLNIFPPTFLYRFLTYDDVLGSVFNNILTTDYHVSIHDEILSTPTQMNNIKYDFDACYLLNLITCNVKRLTILVQEYQERKDNFGITLERWKCSLDEYLKSPDYSPRMNSLIRSICTKLESMSNIVIIVVELMSRWKFSKEFPYLYQSSQNEFLMFENCENTIADFRQSQKKLEQQMVNLIRLFKDDKCEEVLKLVDQIFSENIELDVYLPIFKDKLKNDGKVLEFLDKTPVIMPGREQFV